MSDYKIIRKIHMDCDICDKVHEVEEREGVNTLLINGEKIEKLKTSMDAELKMGNYIIKVRDLFPPRKAPTEPDKQTTT